jgi:ribosomal protein S21
MEESPNKKPFHRQERTGNYAHSNRISSGPREREYRGYYVDVTRSGGDAIKAFRKLKRMYKETKFFEQMREREHYSPPSFKRREKEKERRKVLKKLQRDRDISRTGEIKRKK